MCKLTAFLAFCFSVTLHQTRSDHHAALLLNFRRSTLLLQVSRLAKQNIARTFDRHDASEHARQRGLP
jgi:hypothetical protein